MYYILLHNTILLCTAHYYPSKNSTDLSLTALYSSILHCTAVQIIAIDCNVCGYSTLQCMVLNWITKPNTIFHCTAQHWTILHTLHGTILQCTALYYPSLSTIKAYNRYQPYQLRLNWKLFSLSKLQGDWAIQKLHGSHHFWISWKFLDKVNLLQPSSVSTRESENSWTGLWLTCLIRRLIWVAAETMRLSTHSAQSTLDKSSPQHILFGYHTWDPWDLNHQPQCWEVRTLTTWLGNQARQG